MSMSLSTSPNLHEPPLPRGCFRRLPNVHGDDIHALIKVGGIFASGSKDTTLKIWDSNWNLKSVIHQQNNGYKRWITALTPLNDGENSFASGTRDGVISIWQPIGKLYSDYTVRLPHDHACKDRNKNRINCLHPLPVKDNTHRFLAGLPTLLSSFEWHWDNRISQINSTQVHKNDWVYCIQPLRTEIATEDDYLVVIGSDLELWRKEEDDQVITKWTKRASLIKENPNQITYNNSTSFNVSGKQRPHISDMQYIDTHKIALALFNGRVQIIDISTTQTTGLYENHKKRVWAVVKMSTNMFISGADDGLAIFWDMRQQKYKEVGKHQGRVSCVLSLNEHQFVTASCPDDIRNAEEKGSFTFWDLRV